MGDTHTNMECADCGSLLAAAPSESSCPECGSTSRAISVEIFEGIQVGEWLHGKVRRDGVGGRPSVEFVSGDDFRRATGEWVTIERRIDRQHDAYYERIVNRYGHVIREVSEPLTKHRGRGAAKGRGGQSRGHDGSDDPSA